MITKGKLRRKKRVRNKIRGTSVFPRISVFRSNRFLYAQAIDDENGRTLAFIEGKKGYGAKELGLALSVKLKKAKIEKIVFDKGSYKYHGKIEAFATGLREGGINF